MKKKELIAALLLVTTPAIANVPADTARVIDIEDAVVVARPKENVKLRQTPTSVSLLSADDMQKNGIVGLHNLTGVVPNLFMPDYGSHITSAVYIRGIGSRINTPAIGLYIDNMPVIDKSTYDFHFLDVERIDVLRGPQGTLYGRNTMGGLIHAYTRDPFRHQGTEITIGSATRNTLRKASIMTYQKLNDQLAFSFGGFYEGANGFFRNDSTGKKVDASQQAGVRFRGTYKATSNLRFNLTSSYEYIDEGAYPYLYNGATKGKKESYPTLIGGITANHEGRYRRSLFQTGLTTEYKAPQFTLTSATGYQNLSDRMFMDQDFIKANIYTLEQKQNANTLTEEITFKSKPNKRWQWATGVFGMYQMMRTEAPVNFYSDGMNFLNSVISNAFSSIPEPIASKLQMKLHINNPDLCIDGQFNTPVLNGAIYHQSTFRDFLINRLSLTLGMRLDYEHQSIRYNSKAAAPINYTFSMNPRMLPHPVTMETAPKIADKTNNDFTQLLPKIGFQYELPKKQGTIYATASKGYRSGGYNIQ
ncbi:MAG: TonB-dependent receptor, partial [Bacteroidaceae bacterium]